MFGGLKKKLQEAINRLTGKAEEKPEPKLPEPELPKPEGAEEKIMEEKAEIKEADEIIEEKEKLVKPEEVSEKKTAPYVQKTGPATEEREKIEPELPPFKEEKPGFLGGLLRKVTKTVTEKILSGEEIDRFLNELQRALLENDVALETAEKICSDVKQQLSGRSVKRSEVEKSIKGALASAMLDVMRQEKISIERRIEAGEKPFLIVFLGFNGTGKTTTIAKLAHRLKKYKPVIAAGDTFRAASIEQLEHHAQRLNIPLVKHKYGSDSAAVIFDAVKHAQASGSKVVLADTAGRSHSNVNLMDELKKIVRVNKPDMRVLVLDAITGNDIYDQSRLFNEAAGVDAIILTKADVYEKGGAALSAAHTIKKPVLFLGTGQEYNDLKEFNPEEIVENLLG